MIKKNNSCCSQFNSKNMLRFYSVLFVVLLFLNKTAFGRFQDTSRRWLFESDETKRDVDCKDSEFCYAVPDDCDYSIKPIGKRNFGAEIEGLHLGSLSQKCADALIQEAMMHRFLVFTNQEPLTWQDQIHFTEIMGEGSAFPDATSANRAFHPKVPDNRLGYFSNNPDEGLMYQGTEGWHVDGNTVDLPHTFTIIHCIAANKNGPTLLVPLREITELFTDEERNYLESIIFVSGAKDSIQHPLIYKHPMRHDDTILVALGRLSGQYLQIKSNGEKVQLSKEETQYILDILETKLIGSNLIHTHHWKKGDLLLLNNPSLAHIAGPGSQGSFEVTGLRLMHRSTVGGKVKPSKKATEGLIPLEYSCHNYAPFEENEYCLFSLKNSVFYPRYGEFETTDEQRQRCKNVHKNADLAVIPNEIWNKEAAKIVSHHGVPHWINATNPEGQAIKWEGVPQWLSKDSSSWTFSDWHQPSGQPNDCIVTETCIFIGPNGKWFDLTCGPKIVPDFVPTEKWPRLDPAPVAVWEDGVTYKFNVYPLCGVLKKDI